MARTKQRSRSSSNSRSSPRVDFVHSASERSVGKKTWIILDDDEKFEGHALFDPDLEAEDNPGYVEYKEHWDQQGGRFVPCWGEKSGCVFCRAGNVPSQRAKCAFLVSSINGEDLEEPEVRIFRMNRQTMSEWIDTLDEDGSTLGQKVRIKCISRQDGDYTTKFFEKERLPKKELSGLKDEIPDIEASIQRDLDRTLEAMRITDVLEADDDEDEDEDAEEETARPRGRPKLKVVEDEEDEDEVEEPEEDEDEEVAASAEEDEDEDEQEEAGTELDQEFTIQSVNEAESTFTLKELDSDLYLDESIVDEIDFDDFSKGDTIHVTAVQDSEEDWVATVIKKAGKKTGGKKKVSRR